MLIGQHYELHVSSKCMENSYNEEYSASLKAKAGKESSILAHLF